MTSSSGSPASLPRNEDPSKHASSSDSQCEVSREPTTFRTGTHCAGDTADEWNRKKTHQETEGTQSRRVTRWDKDKMQTKSGVMRQGKNADRYWLDQLHERICTGALADRMTSRKLKTNHPKTTKQCFYPPLPPPSSNKVGSWGSDTDLPIHPGMTLPTVFVTTPNSRNRKCQRNLSKNQNRKVFWKRKKGRRRRERKRKR